MKTQRYYILLLLFMFLTTICSKAQNVTVNFEYDESGNRTKRSIELKEMEENANSVETEDSAGWQTEVSKTIQGAELTIFPNPTNGLISVNIAGADGSNIFRLTLSTLSGITIEECNTANGTTQLDISRLARGMYLLTVSTSDERCVWKIVKH